MSRVEQTGVIGGGGEPPQGEPRAAVIGGRGDTRPSDGHVVSERVVRRRGKSVFAPFITLLRR